MRILNSMESLSKLILIDTSLKKWHCLKVFLIIMVTYLLRIQWKNSLNFLLHFCFGRMLSIFIITVLLLVSIISWFRFSVGSVLCDTMMPIKASSRFTARIVVFNVEMPIIKGFIVSFLLFLGSNVCTSRVRVSFWSLSCNRYSQSLLSTLPFDQCYHVPRFDFLASTCHFCLLTSVISSLPPQLCLFTPMAPSIVWHDCYIHWNYCSVD